MALDDDSGWVQILAFLMNIGAINDLIYGLLHRADFMLLDRDCMQLSAALCTSVLCVQKPDIRPTQCAAAAAARPFQGTTTEVCCD